MKRLIAYFCIVILVVGCSASIKVDDFKPAIAPHGAHSEFKLKGADLDGDWLKGELLAVTEEGVLLNVKNFSGAGSSRSERTIVAIPYELMTHGRIDQMGTARIESQGSEANKMYLNRLRLLSRFPQGLSDELINELLEINDQDQLVRLSAAK